MSFRITPYQHFKVENLASEVEHKESVVGNFIILLSYTGTDDVLISFGGESYQVLPKGIAVELPEDAIFRNVRFKQTSGSAQTFSYAITTGKVFDSRLVLSGSLDVNSSANSVESPAAFEVDDTVQIVVPADSDVREVILQNNGLNDIWLGDEDIDPSTKRGKKLEPGTECVWTCSGAIYGTCETGLTSDLSIVKLKKV